MDRFRHRKKCIPTLKDIQTGKWPARLTKNMDVCLFMCSGYSSNWRWPGHWRRNWRQQGDRWRRGKTSETNF